MCVSGMYDLTEAQLVDDEAEELCTSGRLQLYGGVANAEADAAKKRMFRLQRLDVKKGEEELARFATYLHSQTASQKSQSEGECHKGSTASPK
eukprot:scaffold17175_cov65-Cyclotella_meneghiniana.AAC.8